MNIEKILIIDKDKGESGEYSFSSGANLLVSRTNSQGKSSLLKTMYYGMGLKINQFPLNWNPTKMIIKLDLYNERTEERLQVIRVGELFYVSDNTAALTLKDYTKWLSDKLGIDMKLTLGKVNMTKSVSYPSALITPFYVDQDESWSKKMFSTSSELQMYRDVPKSILDYVLKITDDNELKAKEEIKQLLSQKNKLESKRSSINEVFIDYIESDSKQNSHEISAIKNPLENNKKDIDLFIALMDSANKRYAKDKAERIKLQRDLDQLKKSLAEYKSILKMLGADYEFIKTICKHCNSELTEEQIRTRMEISTDMFEINHLISITKHGIEAAESKLSNAITQEERSNSEYERLSKELDTNIEINSIAEFIEEASKKKSQKEFAAIIKELESQIGRLEGKIKDKNKEKRESVKKSKDLIEEIEYSYQQYVNDLTFIMKGSNVSNIEFENFRAPQSSGVNVNQMYLGVYLTYMRLISEYGRYKLPFCIDSFIKNETAEEKLYDMFEALEKYLLAIKGQSIFSAVEEYVGKYMKHESQFHRVEIGERLLSADKFAKSFEEVKSIIAK